MLIKLIHSQKEDAEIVAARTRLIEDIAEKFSRKKKKKFRKIL